MEFIETELAGVMLIKPVVHQDNRGFFAETFRRSLFWEAGVKNEFVQDNLSRSVKGTLRGLHYQIGKPQGKLVMAVSGEILDVAVDVRDGSPTFGKYVACRLSEENRHMLYIPEGFAHGFFVLSEEATFLYKCTGYYYPEGERGIRWNDPDIGIEWPEKNPVLSAKDQNLPFLSQISSDDLL
ncbi:dTDP-4-dehydrorhamnose 3,5-epimerase [Balneolaceae bacterium ANBcel3]|nr:dTDP-4-dehydrorhamnose 3,5-epimerase [Balneolaceae bacterium ANBcel3]